MSVTTGTIIVIGTTTGIATVATGTGMTPTRAKSNKWARLNNLAHYPFAAGYATTDNCDIWTDGGRQSAIRPSARVPLRYGRKPDITNGMPINVGDMRLQ
jgi:hypothetical protein